MCVCVSLSTTLSISTSILCVFPCVSSCAVLNTAACMYTYTHLGMYIMRFIYTYTHMYTYVHSGCGLRVQLIVGQILDLYVAGRHRVLQADRFDSYGVGFRLLGLEGFRATGFRLQALSAEGAWEFDGNFGLGWHM